MKYSLALLLMCVVLTACALHPQRTQPDFVTTYYEGLAAYERSDYSSAMTLFKQLAINGDAMSQLYVGNMYERGEGVVKDDAEAVRWYRKAALQGYVDAQLNLAEMFNIGTGVEKDEIQAYAWWTLAAAQGESSAVTSLNLLKLHMTSEQIVEAERKAEQIREMILRSSH